MVRNTEMLSGRGYRILPIVIRNRWMISHWHITFKIGKLSHARRRIRDAFLVTS